MYRFFQFLFFLSATMATGTAAAQGLGNSPYSRIGLGDLNGNPGSIRNLGMGGSGVSTANSFQLNSINPALLYYNNYTLFDFGVAGQVKQLATTDAEQTDGSVSLSSLALSFPVSKRWTAAVGLKPFSSVQYKSQTLGAVQGTPDSIYTAVENVYEGSGGISEVYFAHGVKVANGLTVGASASYLFGSVINQSSARVFTDGIQNQRTVFNDRTRYSDFLFKAGTAYRKEVKENSYLAIGGVYTFATNLDAERSFSAQRLGPTDNLIDEVVFTDSVEVSAQLPHSLQLGISYDNGKNWSVAFDFTAQPMSEFVGVDARKALGDSYRLALGTEYTPDMNSVESYFKRVTYRAGISHGRTPYLINGNEINESAVSWGFTFPLRKRPYPQEEHPFINTSFSVGKRGSTESNQIKETYFRFNVGLTINNRWFVKRRIS